MTLLKREIIDGKGERQRRKGSKNTHLSNVNQMMSVVVGMLSLLMTLNKFYSFSMSKYLVEVSQRSRSVDFCTFIVNFEQALLVLSFIV